MIETKQEVFEEVLAEYEADEEQRVSEWGGLPDDEDYRARYAAAQTTLGCGHCQHDHQPISKEEYHHRNDTKSARFCQWCGRELRDE